MITTPRHPRGHAGRPRRHRPRPRRAFTLAEVVVALGLAAVVLLAAQSAVMLASRAVPDDDAPVVARAADGAAMERMLAEIGSAKALLTASATQLVFTVADRNGDQADETIAYTWSGVPGDAVQRRLNNGTPEDIIPKVQGFQLAYDTSTGPDPTATLTSDESVLASYAGAIAGSFSVTSSAGIGEVFTPSLPSDTLRYTVTRAVVSLAVNGTATGTSLVSLRTAWDGAPTTDVVGAVTVAESSLAAGAQPVTVTFPGGVTLVPGTPLALVVRCVAASPSCSVSTVTLGASLSGLSSVTTGDSGQTWTKQPLQQIPFTVYGSVTRPDTGRTLTRCLNIRCAVAAGRAGSALLSGNARTLNQPVKP